MKIPSIVLRQLYTFGSLERSPEGVQFRLKNRLSNATLTRVLRVAINREEIPLDRVVLVPTDDERIAAGEVSAERPVDFPLKQTLDIEVGGLVLERGKHRIVVEFEASPFGQLRLKVEDSIADGKPTGPRLPYDKENDYDPAIIERRRAFVEDWAGVRLDHVGRYSVEPTELRGNVENFTGVAQVPIGMLGPIRIRGEHADGEFLVPLATTEGTLVASYSRGAKLMNLSGGVTCTVLDDCMQRAPVFVFESAREARGFEAWVRENLDSIRQAAEATSSVARLQYIDTYLSNKFAFLRFNFSTGDAAGQNMVGRATFAACGWIVENHPSIQRFFLESNLATDKKASQVNVMHTRGKRVVAEITIPRELLIQHMRVEPESLFYHYNIANVGTILSGANNNGLHSPNAITAMFIATGQDVANVAESSAGIMYTELAPDGGLHVSLTIPSLIVATHGGGTALPTQRECLALMGCDGKGKVNKLAEIVAGVALAGEISLAAAISSLDWVSSHERYGRNR